MKVFKIVNCFCPNRLCPIIIVKLVGTKWMIRRISEPGTPGSRRIEHERPIWASFKFQGVLGQPSCKALLQTNIETA